MQDVAGYFHMLGRTPQNLMERAGGFCYHIAIKPLACGASVCVSADDLTRRSLQPTSPSSRSLRRKSAWTSGGASSGKSSYGMSIPRLDMTPAPSPRSLRCEHEHVGHVALISDIRCCIGNERGFRAYHGVLCEVMQCRVGGAPVALCDTS